MIQQGRKVLSCQPDTWGLPAAQAQVCHCNPACVLQPTMAPGEQGELAQTGSWVLMLREVLTASVPTLSFMTDHVLPGKKVKPII